MKIPYAIESPARGLKPMSLLVAHQAFQETLLWETHDRWMELMKGAEVKAFAPETRLRELLSDSAAGSLFSETRVLRQMRFADGAKWGGAEALAALKKFLSTPQESHLFIAVETPRGKVQWFTQLKDVFSKSAHGQLLEIPRLYEKDAKTLAVRLCGARGLKPTAGAMAAMVRLTDNLPDRLVNEIRKLALYLDDQDPVVKEDTVNLVFDPATEENTFSLLDDLLTGDRGHLKTRLEQFRQQSTSFAPPLVLGSLLHLLETLLEVAAATEGPLQGAVSYNHVKNAMDTNRAAFGARLQGLHPFVLSRHLDLVRRVGKTRLIQSALGLYQLDATIKGAAHSAADPYRLMGEWLSDLMPTGKAG